MIVLGIDPGPTAHGVVIYDSAARRVIDADDADPDCDGQWELRWPAVARVGIEWVEPLGLPLGRALLATIDAAYQIERAVETDAYYAGSVHRVTRSAVLAALGVRRGGKRRAGVPKRSTDSKVRAALMMLHGGPASVKKGGALHGVTSHAWPALAVAWTISR